MEPTLRTNPAVRRTAQILAIVLLLGAVYMFNDRVHNLEAQNDDEEATTAVVGAILAQACDVASFDELRTEGLVEECRLAQLGDLPEELATEDLPDKDVKPEEVPDIVPDDDDSTPGDTTLAPSVTEGQIAVAVDQWFDRNSLPLSGGYERAVKRAVSAYISENPPEDGRPPTNSEISGAVTAALVANPPAPGTDGVNGLDGRSVASASIDGCDVVFVFSDGTRDRVGPICGPPPTDREIDRALASYCAANGECRGPAGPPGVVSVDDSGCDAGNGLVLSDIDATYLADSRSIRVNCTYVGAGGLIP